ncbi:MAG: glycogen synthase [Spirochaetes bacterium]|nr:glycogen synthase [Spirochaetota bacterium]
MKIAFVCSEVYPFARTGGLADVMHALPRALAKSGHEVCIFMPLYRIINKNRFKIELIHTGLKIKINGGEKWSAVFESLYLKNIKTYFINCDEYFGREDLYGDVNNAYAYNDNAERFAFFAKAVLQTLKKIKFSPDIIHCNDWHTGFIPVYLKSIYRNDSFFKNCKTVFTIHNAGYQGFFPKESLDIKEIAEHKFNTENIYHSTGISYLKAGALYSDAVTTVSKQYAREIQTEEYGYDLAYAFSNIRNRLFGILNAIDHEHWNPQTDKYLPGKFSIDNLTGKKICKIELQKKLGLPQDTDTPLAGTVSRLVYQKGVDILAYALELILQDEKIQFVMIGSGDPEISGKYEQLKRMFPEKIGLFCGYDEELEHLAEAGFDIFIMPSRYEPCGLNQMYSLKYGTVPVVRKTGGLDDIITDWTENRESGNGFKMTGLSGEEIYNTVRKVIRIYNNKNIWKKVQHNGMKFNYSWDDAVIEYKKVYELILKS